MVHTNRLINNIKPRKMDYSGQVKCDSGLYSTVMEGVFPGRKVGVKQHTTGYRTLKTWQWG